MDPTITIQDVSAGTVSHPCQSAGSTNPARILAKKPPIPKAAILRLRRICSATGRNISTLLSINPSRKQTRSTLTAQLGQEPPEVRIAAVQRRLIEREPLRVVELLDVELDRGRTLPCTAYHNETSTWPAVTPTVSVTVTISGGPT